MKRFILAALLSLPMLAAAGQTASAGDCCSPTFRLGFSMAFKGWAGCSNEPGCCPNPNPCCGGGGCGPCCSSACVNWGQLAPWYLYWPYDGHFQTPAPTGFPYYPPPMTAMGFGAPAPNYGAMAAYGYGQNYGQSYGYSAPNFGAPTMQAGYYPQINQQVQPASYYQQAPGYWYGR